MKRNYQTFEKHLNELYADTFAYQEALDQFDYLSEPGRAGGRCQPQTLVNAINRKALGTLLRKYDPIAFYKSFTEWR